MPLSDQAIRRYQQQLHTYRSRTAAQLLVVWDRLGAWDEQQVDEFEEATAPILTGAKVAAVSLSAAVFALALGIPPAAVNPDDVDVEPDIRGPFAAMWHAFSMGRPFEEAFQAGRSTVGAVGETFIQSTARRTGDVVAERSDRRVRWRRVPDADACDWCRQVAGEQYLTAESADFGHQRCFCDVLPA